MKIDFTPKECNLVYDVLFRGKYKADSSLMAAIKRKLEPPKLEIQPGARHKLERAAAYQFRCGACGNYWMESWGSLDDMSGMDPEPGMEVECDYCGTELPLGAFDDPDLNEFHIENMLEALTHRDVFYYGCIGRPGHYLWAVSDNGNPYSASWMFDHTTEKYAPLPWGYDLGGRLCPSTRESDQPEGFGKIHHVDGWTAWAFFDRTVDVRLGCSSVFIAKGEFDLDNMKYVAERFFHKIWKRIQHLDFRLEDSK